MRTRIVNNNNIYYCCEFFLTLDEHFVAEFIYLFMREFRLYVYIFHSTVTGGPTDYLKDKDEMNFFDHIYGLKF